MVRIQGSRVAVIGGSIAGCAAAIALARMGCDVHVFERSSSALQDRGSGVMLPPALRDELIVAGYLPPEFPTCPFDARLWIVADGTPAGRELWEQPGFAAATNWGVLWRALRSRIPDGHYHDGMRCETIHENGDLIEVDFSDGTSETFDALIGADGYRSVVRAFLFPESQPEFAGYVAWRGTYPEERLTQRAAVDLGDARRAWFLVGFDGGHSILYTVPNFDARVDSGHRRVNWLVYAQLPAGMDFTSPTSIPPGNVTHELYRSLERLLLTSIPPDFQDLIRGSSREEISIQPIYDQHLESYVRGQVAVIGDAGAVCRPHTASGTAKALEDARCLERLAHQHADWGDLLPAYGTERSAAGSELVELGRRIGRDQVQHNASWTTLSARDMPTWTSNTLAGSSLYFYGGKR